MKKGTAHDWLEFLDNCDPPDEAWRDGEWVQAISWCLLMFVPRRLAQRLSDAGQLQLIQGTDYRSPSSSAQEIDPSKS